LLSFPFYAKTFNLSRENSTVRQQSFPAMTASVLKNPKAGAEQLSPTTLPPKKYFLARTEA